MTTNTCLIHEHTVKGRETFERTVLYCDMNREKKRGEIYAYCK